MRLRRHSLRARVVFTMVSGVLATSLILSLAAIAVAYSTEDRWFRHILEAEITYQQSSWDRTGTLAAPKNPDVVIYRTTWALPSDIRERFAQNPHQYELYGREGRHYHVQRFELNDHRPGSMPASAIAVIEVSRNLVVHPLRDSITQLLVGISLVIASFMAAIGWWLVNRALKPLSDLAIDVANSQSSVPLLNAKNYPANEIGMLAEALQQAFARIRGFVDRERTFTRDASHELRTPLAVVRGAAEVIALDPNFPSHLTEPLRRIETATTDLTLALDQLLALARENEGVPKETATLRPMIDKAVHWSKVRYPGAAVTVLVNLDSGAAVFVHPTSLQLVLNNLIGNCFQHVRSGKLTIEFEGGCLSLEDDGPGFTSDADLFAPFAKGKASVGSGLGLDISRRLCEAARIRLTVTRGKSGRGASFRLDFPNP